MAFKTYQRDSMATTRPPTRSASLQKYKRIDKPRETTPDDEIRVMGTGRVSRYVMYACKLLGNEVGRSNVTIRATGKAVAIAVSVCEVVKRRITGLHQVTTIGWTEITDEYEPLDTGLEKRIEKRSVASISIFLTKDESAVDKSAPGYQPPLADNICDQENDTPQTEALGNVDSVHRRPQISSRRHVPRRRPKGPSNVGNDHQHVTARTPSSDGPTTGPSVTRTPDHPSVAPYHGKRGPGRRNSRKINRKGVVLQKMETAVLTITQDSTTAPFSSIPLQSVETTTS